MPPTILDFFSCARQHGRASLTICCLSALSVVAACGGGGDGSPTGNPPASKTGTLSVLVSGLPSAATAAITVTGPGTYSRTLSAAESITGLAPGTYSVAAVEVTGGADRFGPSQATQATSVVAASTSAVTVSYSILTGSLTVNVSGLPGSAQPSVSVTGPDGYARTITATTTIGGLRPGVYVVSATQVVAEGHTWAPATPRLELPIAAGATATSAGVSYQLATGGITLGSAGLPPGASGTATLTGPGQLQQTITLGQTVTNLVPGSYTLVAEPVAVGSDQFRASVPLTISVAASATPVAAMLQYALASGRLSVAVSGLPAGANPSVAVTGPDGFAKTLTASETLNGLHPGTYTLAASSVVLPAATYSASLPTQQIAVVASSIPVQATVAYAVSSGSMAIVVNGLPQSVSASIAVTGPDGYTAKVTVTSTLSNLRAGTYTLTAENALAGPHIYASSSASRTVVVSASATAAPPPFVYALASGGFAFTVNGLPPSVPAAVTITGPGGYTKTVTTTSLLQSLTPGTYTVAAAVVQSGSSYWAPNPATQTVTVTPSLSTMSVSVTYWTAVGSLTVTVNGLPAGVNANVSVTGPNSYSRAITSTTTLSGLLQGVYNVAAAAVGSGATNYTPNKTSQNVSIGGGATSGTIVTYTVSSGPPPPPPGLNFTIDGLHVQQVVQSYAGAVPLVAGKPGLLRVFVKAAASNSAAPVVRVRFYNGAILSSTISITSPAASTPTAITEGTLASSWNYQIPGSLMQPGLKVLADVDPSNTIVETSESDNSFPVSGTAAALDVRAVSTFGLRFVPVVQSVNGLAGDVTAANAEQFLADTRKLYPLNVVDADIRAPFTTSAPALESNEGNGAWSQILSEINALRISEGSARFYYGVVKTNYSSGVAGMGYVPGRSAIGWDPLWSASEVMAHELGHNFGRFHAPCGGVSGPDASYPYAGGVIGVYGYDAVANTLKAPTMTDLMGYCNNVWISDYTYTAVLDYRTANPFSSASVLQGRSARRGLLVWGRVHNGQLMLEPTFEVTAPPVLPTRPGRNRIEAFGPLGERVFDLSFEGERVADANDPNEQHFAFVVPMETFRDGGPTRLRFSRAGRQVELASSASAAPTAPEIVAERMGRNAVRVSWRNTATRGVLVRDARTGDILAFGRGGTATVQTRESDVDLVVSDGVRSVRQRVRILPAGGTPRR